MSTATMTNPAGNWRRFDSFAWFERPADADDYAIVYTHNRDSDSIDRANAITIAEALKPWIDGDAGDVIEQRHSHWACGWCNGYAIRVQSANGQETPAWQTWTELQARIADYPILDEFKHSEVFIEDCEQSWHSWVAYDFRRELESIYGELAIPAPEFRDQLDDRIHISLRDLFDVCRERVDADYEEDSGGPYLNRDMHEIAAAITASEIEPYLAPEARAFVATDNNGRYWVQPQGIEFVPDDLATCPYAVDGMDVYGPFVSEAAARRSCGHGGQ